MKTIRSKRLACSWPLAVLVAGGLFLAGCGAPKHEAPQETTEEAVPNPPEVAPPIEQQDAERTARDENPRCMVVGEEVASRSTGRREQRVSGKERKDTDKADLEGFEGHLGFEPGTALRALQGRSLQSGANLIEGSEIRIRAGQVAPKPSISGAPPQPYSFTIDMRLPDQTRRGHGMRMDVGDAPYSTMAPITPDVSEGTVRPFD